MIVENFALSWKGLILSDRESLIIIFSYCVDVTCLLKNGSLTQL